MTDISLLKKQLRQQLILRRKQLSAEQRQTYSAQIMQHLFQFLASQKSVEEPIHLLVYRALTLEVNTDSLFEQTKHKIFVPRILPDTNMEWVHVNQETIWQKMDFGVMEPTQGELWKSGHTKTILISPLLGFDRSGDRLGMGKGFFDRWLEKFGSDLELQLGLAFSCQELPKVPVEPHDAPLSAIITESGVITCPIN